MLAHIFWFAFVSKQCSSLSNLSHTMSIICLSHLIHGLVGRIQIFFEHCACLHLGSLTKEAVGMIKPALTEGSALLKLLSLLHSTTLRPFLAMHTHAAAPAPQACLLHASSHHAPLGAPLTHLTLLAPGAILTATLHISHLPLHRLGRYRVLDLLFVAILPLRCLRLPYIHTYTHTGMACCACITRCVCSACGLLWFCTAANLPFCYTPPYCAPAYVASLLLLLCLPHCIPPPASAYHGFCHSTTPWLPTPGRMAVHCSDCHTTTPVLPFSRRRLPFWDHCAWFTSLHYLADSFTLLVPTFICYSGLHTGCRSITFLPAAVHCTYCIHIACLPHTCHLLPLPHLAGGRCLWLPFLLRGSPCHFSWLPIGMFSSCHCFGGSLRTTSHYLLTSKRAAACRSLTGRPATLL